MRFLIHYSHLHVNDYNELENALNGITLSNGMEFGLVYYPNGSTNLFGYVRYVLPNTDAATKGIQRGILFNTINAFIVLNSIPLCIPFVAASVFGNT